MGRGQSTCFPFIRNVCVDDSDLLVQLTTFMQRLAYEFSKRWNEEHQPECKTPIVRLL